MGKKGRKSGSGKKSASTQGKSIVGVDPRASIEAAALLEGQCRLSYPPSVPYDAFVAQHDEYACSIAYRKCTESFNAAATQTTVTAATVAGTSRWHKGISQLCDAIYDGALKQKAYFLTVQEPCDGRFLLSKCCLTIAQFYGKILLSKEQLAWAKTAVACDPTYWNCHNQLGLAYFKQNLWKESLAVCEAAMRCDGQKSPDLQRRMYELQVLLHSPDKKVRKSKVAEILHDRRGVVFRILQEAQLPYDTGNSCHLCWYPADKRCTRCEVVQYCSTECQRADWGKHKQSCIACLPPATAPVTYPDAHALYGPPTDACPDEDFKIYRNHPQFGTMPLINLAAVQTSPAVLKRALVGGDDPNYVYPKTGEYPLHQVAVRNEPAGAVEAFRVLLRHGACPNVLRGVDGLHLIEVCQLPAVWMTDKDPGTSTVLYKLQHCGVNGTEIVERNESEALVTMTKEAIATHHRCKYCIAENQPSSILHLMVENSNTAFVNTHTLP